MDCSLCRVHIRPYQFLNVSGKKTVTTLSPFEQESGESRKEWSRDEIDQMFEHDCLDDIVFQDAFRNFKVHCEKCDTTYDTNVFTESVRCNCPDILSSLLVQIHTEFLDFFIRDALSSVCIPFRSTACACILLLSTGYFVRETNIVGSMFSDQGPHIRKARRRMVVRKEEDDVDEDQKEIQNLFAENVLSTCMECYHGFMEDNAFVMRYHTKRGKENEIPLRIQWQAKPSYLNSPSDLRSHHALPFSGVGAEGMGGLTRQELFLKERYLYLAYEKWTLQSAIEAKNHSLLSLLLRSGSFSLYVDRMCSCGEHYLEDVMMGSLLCASLLHGSVETTRVLCEECGQGAVRSSLECRHVLNPLSTKGYVKENMDYFKTTEEVKEHMREKEEEADRIAEELIEDEEREKRKTKKDSKKKSKKASKKSTRPLSPPEDKDLRDVSPQNETPTKTEEEAKQPLGFGDGNKEKKEDGSVLPDCFLCPITLCEMVDPVVVSSGHTYERKAILDWMKTCNLDPLSGVEIEDTVYPNWGLLHAKDLFVSLL